MGFVFPNQYFLKNVLVSVIFVLQTFVLMYTNFYFDDLSYHTIISILIAIIFTLILIPAFGYITD